MMGSQECRSIQHKQRTPRGCRGWDRWELGRAPGLTPRHPMPPTRPGWRAACSMGVCWLKAERASRTPRVHALVLLLDRECSRPGWGVGVGFTRGLRRKTAMLWVCHLVLVRVGSLWRPRKKPVAVHADRPRVWAVYLGLQGPNNARQWCRESWLRRRWRRVGYGGLG